MVGQPGVRDRRIHSPNSAPQSVKILTNGTSRITKSIVNKGSLFHARKCRCRSTGHTSPSPAAFLFRPNCSSVTHDGPDKAVGAKRQCEIPSGALTPRPGSFVGPDSGRKKDGAYTNRRPASSRAVVQNGAEQNDESGTVPDTSQVSQTQPPPLRVKAASSNLRQTLLSGLPAVKSPLPHNSGGTASEQVAAQK